MLLPGAFRNQEVVIIQESDEFASGVTQPVVPRHVGVRRADRENAHMRILQMAGQGGAPRIAATVGDDDDFDAPRLSAFKGASYGSAQGFHTVHRGNDYRKQRVNLRIGHPAISLIQPGE
jgi:hypothetical protein